ELKLDPRGEMGKLIGFNVDLNSYKIYTSDGQFVDSKNVVFLDFESNPVAYNNSDNIHRKHDCIGWPYPRFCWMA
ncbi:hypothetical protein VP01_3924g2, partial [Puccinia sorghi]